MAFIVALGIIILLLCSASIFRLIQPKQKSRPAQKTYHYVKPSTHVVKAAASPKLHHKPKRKVIDDLEEESEASMPNIKPVEAVIPIHKPASVPAAKVPPVFVKVPEIISFHLRPLPDTSYAGYELLQALLSAGMRFGQSGLFHRHEKKTGTGPILFSLASCTKEGTFDLSGMGGFSCKGLILFMKPKEVQDSVKVFELLLETADQLIRDLGGDVLSEQQQLLKKEDVFAIHEKLQRYVHALV